MTVGLESFVNKAVKIRLKYLDKKLGFLVGLRAEESFRQFLHDYIRGIKTSAVRDKLIKELYIWGKRCVRFTDFPYYERRGFDLIALYYELER